MAEGIFNLVLNTSINGFTDPFEAEEFLKKNTIHPHAALQDQNGRIYLVNRLLAEFANERFNILRSYIPVEKELPPLGEVVIGTDGKSFACLCLRFMDNIEDDYWCWAEVKGIYLKDGKICEEEAEMDDLDIKFWLPLPKFIAPEVSNAGR